MSDRTTHGVLTHRPPAQTYCGLPTEGKNTTDDPFAVTCNKCKSMMELMGLLPSKNPNITTQRGRPKKKGGIFGW